jgi:hypothetical protein
VKNPVTTISQKLLLTAIALLVAWLPLSNSNVLINGIQTAKYLNFFYEKLSGNKVNLQIFSIEKIRVEVQQIKIYKERDTTKNNTSLLIKHQFW